MCAGEGGGERGVTEYFDKTQCKHTGGGVKKGFNEPILKEKSGFVNSQCAVSPDSRILIPLSSENGAILGDSVDHRRVINMFR